MSVDLIIALTITCVVWSLVPDAAHKQKETGLAVPSRHSSDRGYRGQASGPSGDAVSTRRWLGTLGFMLAWYIAQPLFHTPATMSMASREVARKIAVDSTLMGPKLLCVTVNWLPPPFHVNGQVWSEVASETFGRHCLSRLEGSVVVCCVEPHLGAQAISARLPGIGWGWPG